MNVSELIEKLKDFPADTRVVVRGYEGGFSDMDEIEETEIYLNCYTGWYYGPHEEVEYAHEVDKDKEKVPAIILK